MKKENNVKVNGDVTFYENDHLYVNTKDASIKYISVTTLIKDFHEEFDDDFWSGYKALESLMGNDFKDLRGYLLTKKKIDFDVKTYVDPTEYRLVKQEILDGYELKRKTSSEYGTEIHKQKEEKFYKGGKINPKDCGFLLHDDVFDCERNNFDLNREKAVLPEYLVYYSDGMVNIAGQMDLLIKNGNDIYIYDFKTNENGIESKSYYDKFTKKSKKMFYPLSHLDDCKLQHYTVQLSLYAWMLQQINPDFKIKRLCLVHIDRNNKETEIDVDYRKEDIVKMLKAYKKKLNIKKLKNG
jgi:hypothetical protein